RVDTEEDGHPVEVEQKCESQPQHGVQSQERGEAEEDAEGEGRGSALGRVVDVQERAHPPAGQFARQTNHRKWPYPPGSGVSCFWLSEPHRSKTALSVVQTPIRVNGVPAWRVTCASRRRA